MGKEYVQEHILTDGIVAPVRLPRRLIHCRLEPFRSALSRHARHISSGLAVVVLIAFGEPWTAAPPPND
jgi:hypothetical protein